MEKELEDLLKEEPNIILNNFMTERLSIMSLLNVQNSCPQRLVMALELIHKACKSANDANLVTKFLCHLAACKDYFITAVSILVGKELSAAKSIESNFLETVVNLLDMMVQSVPTVSISILEILLPQLLEVCKKHSENEHIFRELEKLEREQEAHIAMMKNTKKSSKPPATVPFDFRLLPNVPSIEEMFSDKPFLRPAVVDGPYSDVEQYLDIHFRLLREDMFQDFRTCLADFHSHKTLQKGRLYHNAYVDKMEQTNNGTILYFVVPVRSKINWKITKRLAPGSLLCLSCDGFKSFYFGCIRSRKDDGQDANICYLALSFEPTKEPEYFLKFYTIIEAGGYYETYKYIFEKLKILTSSTFPFGNCLIDYGSSDCAPFSLNSEQELQLRTFQSEINDDNQTQAFELALRNKVALIQGPPGTGKSYLGVQIARYLTQIDETQKPVIVMCYTNHALDQILEKMLDFTKKIVRIGGQSNSPTLKFHNLDNLRRKQNYDQKIKERRRSNKRNKNIKGLSIDSFRIFCDIYGNRKEFLFGYPNHVYGYVKRGCETVSQSLNDCLKVTKYPFTKITMDVKLSDLPGLHEVLTKDKLKGSVFNTVLHTADQIRLHHWLMTDKLLCNVYDQMTGFKKMLTEELLDFFQLTKTLKMKNTAEGKKLDSLAELLIRLCIKQKSNSFLLPRNAGTEIIHFIHHSLFSNELVFPLFLRAAVRFSEKNSTTINEQCNNLWMLDINQRWKLLIILLAEISTFNVAEKLQLDIPYYKKILNFSSGKGLVEDSKKPFEIQAHEKYCEELKDYETERDAYFLQGADIVGITTTGAGKNFDLLKKTKATTYIIEEAAEVFESHIVATLVPDIKHLVLIGDHFQLRPSPTVYNLAVKYHLDVSLFERLFKNKVPAVCLQVQHRMRPSIARLLVPDFYHSLDNHPSVLEYENIAGMSSNVFFLQHSKLENETDELKSHSNSYESLLVVTICEYLISQGHDPSAITILTTYAGQLHLIQTNKQMSSAKPVLATTVDNYQGEENDIIIISFVRSNVDNSVGFIKTHNRLCVALSRARKGLYCVGNFNMLASQSQIWQSLLIKLQNMGSLGESLVINCCRHPEIKSLVSTPFDFQSHMKKGCHEPCNELLTCGHTCCLLCHEQDTKHIGNQCNLKCKQKIIEQFPLQCDEGIEIDNLLDEVIEILCIEDDSCGKNLHEECPGNFLDITDKSIAGSNHKKIAEEENHSQPGKSKVIGDYNNVSNDEADETLNQNDLKATLELSKSDQSEKKENTTILSCGHVLELENKLSWRRFGITYAKCEEMIVSQMKCGERVNHVCGEQANHLNCSSPLLLKCGHKVPCNTNTNAYICQQDLEISLKCGHNKLVSCCKSKEHFVCEALVKRSLSCGHNLEIKCSTLFPLCHQRCMFRCDHMQCINPCYVACFPCREPCTWNCEHYRCDKLCSEICDRPPCDKPCLKTNPSCGHPCSGFCGEPCPTFCQRCNKSASGNNERFTLLEDCGHCIPYIELSNVLTKYESQNACPRCPECNTPITKNVRFGNMLKLYKSRKEITFLAADLPVIHFLQPCVSDFESDEHVKALLNELQKENLKDENYLSKLRVARQLHVLFCMKKFQEHLGGNYDDYIQMLYNSLKENETTSYDINSSIFRIGAILFIEEIISKRNMLSKVGLVNEMFEDIMDCLRKPAFNGEMVEVVQEMVNSVSHLDCPTLNDFIEFLKELQFAFT